jgi:cysteine desulfurase/selenocysteine lyase
MISMAHAAGAAVLIDGAQSAPHMAIDVQALDADFFLFSGHKTYGPTGIGVLYAKLKFLEAMPPYQGGGDMIERVAFEKTTYAPPPLKFEAGTPIIAEAIALGTAIDYISGIGLDRISSWELELLEEATKQIEEIPQVKILGTAAYKGSLITFTVEGVHPLDIGTLLDLQGFAIRTGHLCAQPVLRRFGLTHVCRVSLAFYNTKQEISQFTQALKVVISTLYRS